MKTSSIKLLACAALVLAFSLCATPAHAVTYVRYIQEPGVRGPVRHVPLSQHRGLHYVRHMYEPGSIRQHSPANFLRPLGGGRYGGYVGRITPFAPPPAYRNHQWRPVPSMAQSRTSTARTSVKRIQPAYASRSNKTSAAGKAKAHTAGKVFFDPAPVIKR